METTISIKQALAYLERHLTEPATVEQAASSAGYSRHHFSRTFLAMTGLTPIGYLRKRRLSEAARELVTSSKRILDIALDYQFGSQEAFTRSFKQEFGVSPGFYRRRGRLHRLWGKISLGVSHLLYPGKGINAVPKLHLPEQQIVAAMIAPHVQLGCASTFATDTAITPVEKINTRLAHRQDIPLLCRLYHELHESTAHGLPQWPNSVRDYECFDASAWSLSMQTRKDATDIKIWVAEISGQVVGLAEVYLRQDEQNTMAVAQRYGYLQSLVVRRQLRGRGIGAQLLAAAEAWARSHGATELRLETWEFERGPLGFYAQRGCRTLLYMQHD